VFRKSATELIEEYRRFSTGSQVLNGRGTFDPESILARQRFMRRIQKLVEGVMRWRRYTKERDGLGILVSDLVKVLEEVALPGWDVGGEDIVRKVCCHSSCLSRRV
jgi:GC-rich sequence DNA-binding factor